MHAADASGFEAAPEVPKAVAAAAAAAAVEGNDSIKPCSHNDWDDVRTRKGHKVLRCRECQGRWKIPSSNVPRCMAFLHDYCKKGTECEMLHVRRKKNTILERYERFGDSVLKGTSCDVLNKAKAEHRPAVSEDSDDEPPELLDDWGGD